MTLINELQNTVFHGARGSQNGTPPPHPHPEKQVRMYYRLGKGVRNSYSRLLQHLRGLHSNSR